MLLKKQNTSVQQPKIGNGANCKLDSVRKKRKKRIKQHTRNKNYRTPISIFKKPKTTEKHRVPVKSEKLLLMLYITVKSS